MRTHIFAVLALIAGLAALAMACGGAEESESVATTADMAAAEPFMAMDSDDMEMEMEMMEECTAGVLQNGC